MTEDYTWECDDDNPEGTDDCVTNGCGFDCQFYRVVYLDENGDAIKPKVWDDDDPY